MALTQVSTGGVKDGTLLNADLNASAAIAGTKIDPTFTTAGTFVNNVTVSGVAPQIIFTDTNQNPDFSIKNDSGQLQFFDTTNNANIFSVITSGAATLSLLVQDEIVHTGDSDTKIAFDTDIIKLETAGSERLKITSSGYTGIRRDTPLGTLHIATQQLSGGTSPTSTAAPNPTYDALIVDGQEVPVINMRSRGDGGASYAALFFSDNVRAAGQFAYHHVLGSDTDFFRFTVNSSTIPLEIDASGATVQGDLTVSSSLAKIVMNDTDGGDQYQIRNDAGTFIIRNGTDSKSALTIDGACVTSILNATPPATGVSVLHVSNSGSATTLGTAATLRVSNNGGNGAYSVFEAESSTGSIRLGNDGQFYVTGASTFSNDIRVDRGSAIDGLLGQAYSSYFGLKHADQTLNSEYMMISNNSHTFISCTSGYSIYLRPSANSSAHQTIFAHDNTTYKTNILMDSHPIRRSQHHWGHLEGGQDNIGVTDAKTSPIYTIGSSYNPTDSALSNMYGIGFSHGNASFTPTGAGWGLYVAADGDARIFLDGSNGMIHLTDGGGSIVFANDDWSGEKSTGKIQTHGTNMYLQNAGGSWQFRKTNGTAAATIASNGTYTPSDLTFKKNVATISNSVDTIKKLIGRSFTWKEDDKKSFGVIAQEVETVLPELVTTSEEPEGSEVEPKKMLNYSAFAGHFIEAIKELATKVEALETEVAALKAS